MKVISNFTANYSEDPIRFFNFEEFEDRSNVIAPKYWFDYKTSTGWWRGVDSIVNGWNYMDRSGKLFTSEQCKKEWNNV